MHSKIFQITAKRLDKRLFLNEFTLKQGQFCWYDYCKWISEYERTIHIDDLVMNALPKGMFTRMSEDEIRYNGGIGLWKNELMDKIKEKAAMIKAETIMDAHCTPIVELLRLLNNPLDIDYNFYLHEDCKEIYAVESLEFMQFVSKIEPGTILYTSAVSLIIISDTGRYCI